LIFGQCGYLFAINWFVQALWLVIWKRSTPTAFLLALVDIAILLSTGLVILQYSMYAKLSLFEIISLRAGFSIYIGWVTAASILNVSYVLLSSGMKNNHVAWGKAILCVAYIVYAAYGFIERNPLYSFVFIIVLLGIKG